MRTCGYCEHQEQNQGGVNDSETEKKRGGEQCAEVNWPEAQRARKEPRKASSEAGPECPQLGPAQGPGRLTVLVKQRVTRLVDPDLSGSHAQEPGCLSQTLMVYAQHKVTRGVEKIWLTFSSLHPHTQVRESSLVALPLVFGPLGLGMPTSSVSKNWTLGVKRSWDPTLVNCHCF